VPERGVTDRSFDVALTILFRDGPAHDAYQVDPIHLAFVEGNKEAWTAGAGLRLRGLSGPPGLPNR
jgi:hypothetical protein